MPKNKPQRLNDVLGPLAPEGHNDARWFLIEHQLMQAQMSIQTAVGSLRLISDNPENEGERQTANECLTICRDMFIDFHEYLQDFNRHATDTDVSEKISRKEL